MTTTAATNSEFTQVHASGHCCQTNPGQVGVVNAGMAPTPAVCEWACSANKDCRFFSHSTDRMDCYLCTSCKLGAHGNAVEYTSWAKSNQRTANEYTTVDSSGWGTTCAEDEYTTVDSSGWGTTCAEDEYTTVDSSGWGTTCAEDDRLGPATTAASEDDCRQRCDNTHGCHAFEWAHQLDCDGGNSNRRCKLFWECSQHVSTTCTYSSNGDHSARSRIPRQWAINNESGSIPRGTANSRMVLVVNTDSDRFIAYGVTFWSERCKQIPEAAEYVRVVIGQWVDYFKPTLGTSWCGMLQSNRHHQWSTDVLIWKTPSYDARFVGGGSGAGWPESNGGGNRKYLSSWATQSGGCCSSLKGSYVDAPELGLGFVMHYYQDSSQCACLGTHTGTHCETCKGCLERLTCGADAGSCAVHHNIAATYPRTTERLVLRNASLAGVLPDFSVLPNLVLLDVSENPRLDQGLMWPWVAVIEARGGVVLYNYTNRIAATSNTVPLSTKGGNTSANNASRLATDDSSTSSAAPSFARNGSTVASDDDAGTPKSARTAPVVIGVALVAAAVVAAGLAAWHRRKKKSRQHVAVGRHMRAMSVRTNPAFDRDSANATTSTVEYTTGVPEPLSPVAATHGDGDGDLSVYSNPSEETSLGASEDYVADGSIDCCADRGHERRSVERVSNVHVNEGSVTYLIPLTAASDCATAGGCGAPLTTVPNGATYTAPLEGNGTCSQPAGTGTYGTMPLTTADHRVPPDGYGAPLTTAPLDGAAYSVPLQADGVYSEPENTSLDGVYSLTLDPMEQGVADGIVAHSTQTDA